MQGFCCAGATNSLSSVKNPAAAFSPTRLADLAARRRRLQTIDQNIDLKQSSSSKAPLSDRSSLWRRPARTWSPGSGTLVWCAMEQAGEGAWQSAAARRSRVPYVQGSIMCQFAYPELSPIAVSRFGPIAEPRERNCRPGRNSFFAVDRHRSRWLAARELRS